MIAVILQPSYIPWRGYFDQIRRAEIFIFYDDVQYDKHGWRNRNQIKSAAGKQWLTIPVHSAGVTAGIPIRDVKIDWSKPWVKNHQKALETSYSRAPFYREYAPLLESIYSRQDEFIADFTIETTKLLAGALGIRTTRFLRSSEMQGAAGRKTERLIQILRAVGAEHYLSGPSARDYIDAGAFAEAGIMLEYMKYDYPDYPQLYPPFDPNVSALDLLFMTGAKAIQYVRGERRPRMSLEDALEHYRRYFNEKIEAHGAVPQGVDYNGPEAQSIRFQQLVKVIDPVQQFDILDYGCGYGGLLTFLQATGWDFRYHGYDMLERMIQAARDSHREAANADFTDSEAALQLSDYVIAGAIFNNRFEAPVETWQEHTLRVLDKLDDLCTRGLAFNMLSAYSDADRMAQRPDLYFADPLLYFDYCKRNFSRDVALLHDYGLYDFTIIVRKQS